MNYLLPVEDDVLPMHYSASMDPVTHETAVFFGLSGTGKTTLSANPTRLLIGDDEHGWSDMGIFNIEGGSTPNARAWTRSTSLRSSTPSALARSAKTWCSTRAASPTTMTSRSRTTRAWPTLWSTFPTRGPRAWAPLRAVVLFLTCDAFGVLPPISRLTADAAMYHFVTGFTAKSPAPR